MKLILLLHRYIGAVIGLVMTLWCLSGFVMMYQGYPKVTEAQRLAGLQPLRLTGCCAEGLRATSPVAGFRIEMLAGRPVLRVRTAEGAKVRELATGASAGEIMPSTALAVARTYAENHGEAGAVRDIALIGQDQWTVEDASRRGRVYRIGFSDPARSVVYVSERTGEVVQATTRASRIWGWLGAVPHWFYPALLRRNVALWTGVVVWTALIGCFLTLTGLYIGVSRFRRYASGRWSPYRGWHYWHHLISLGFGVLTLTWVASGFLTMTPWGLLDTSVGEAERAALRGQIAPDDVRRFLGVAPGLAHGGVVALDAAPLDGRLFVLERFADGGVVRVDAAGAPAPLGRPELSGALRRLDAPIADLTLIRREDAYYYAGYDHGAPLPAWRVRTSGPAPRTYYLDAVTGELALALDSTARASRWLRTGLHDLDFPGLRARPLWDIVSLALLAGVTAGCATGTWIGFRRLAHDLRRLRRAGRP